MSDIFPNRYEDALPLEVRIVEEVESGLRMTSDEFRLMMKAKYDEGQPERDAHAAKKKAAADELIALGVSKESAYLITNYYEEDYAIEEARIKSEYEASKKNK